MQSRKKQGRKARILTGLLLVMAVLTLFGWVRTSNSQARFSAERQERLHNGEAEAIFASLSRAPVHLRRGPGTIYAIEWRYQRAHLPVQVLRENNGWYRIRDFQGIEGWIHKNGLSWRQRVILTGTEDQFLFRTHIFSPGNANIVARIKPNVIGDLLGCNISTCEAIFNDMRGWIRRDQLWGASKTSPEPSIWRRVFSDLGRL